MKHIGFQVGSIVKVKDKTEDPDFGTKQLRSDTKTGKSSRPVVQSKYGQTPKDTKEVEGKSSGRAMLGQQKPVLERPLIPREKLHYPRGQCAPTILTEMLSKHGSEAQDLYEKMILGL